MHMRHEAGRNNFIILKSQVALNSVEEEVALADNDNDDDDDGECELESDTDELDTSESRHGVVPGQAFRPSNANAKSYTSDSPGHSVSCYLALRRIVHRWWSVVVRETNCCASGTRVRSIRLSADEHVATSSEHEALRSASPAPGAPVADSVSAVLFPAPLHATTDEMTMSGGGAMPVSSPSRPASPACEVSESGAALMLQSMPSIRSEAPANVADAKSERLKSKIKIRPVC